MNKACLLYGGGLESTYAAFILKNKKIDLFFLNYNQKANEQEFKKSKEISKLLKIKLVKKDDKFLSLLNKKNKNLLLNGYGSHFVYCRNLVLCLLAAEYGYTKIYICSHKKDNVSDKSISFFKKLSSVLSSSFDREIEIIRFSTDQKKMAKFLKQKKISVWSCWNPINKKPCLKCSHCKKLKILEML